MEEERPQTLSRELLRWVQSLDLAYSVKNVKRDFSNGFLIAEIFSRYYDKDIQMHSFDNGIALRIKKDNWGQLLKFLRRVGLQDLAPQDEVNAIIHCEDGAVVSFINRIYEVLTQRKVQVITKRPLPEPQPAYTRSTGAAAIRSTMRGAALAETSDELSRERKIREKIGEHERSLQEERSLDPERFSSASHAAKGMMRGPPRAVGSEAPPVPQVQVKEIQVKQVDRSIAQLRATKEMTLGGSASGAGGMPAPAMTQSTAEQIPSAPSGGGAVSSGGGGGGGVQTQSATSLLNACVSRTLSSMPEMAKWDSSREPIQNFVSALCDGDVPSIPEEAASEVLAEIAAQAGSIADACASSPKQYWQVSDVLTALAVDLADGSVVFEAAIRAFTAVGEQMLKKDASAATGVFLDFSLPRLISLLRTSAAKRVAVLRVMYAFVAPDITSHMQCIKRLQGLLDDLTAFLHCVTTLVFLEPEFDDSLLDLYMYYCVISMAQPSPTLRAASVAMLSATLPQQPEMLGQYAQQLLSMAKQDPWWEVQAQLLVLCGALVPMLPNDPTLHEIIDTVFHSQALVAVRKVGLWALSDATAHVPKIVAAYTEVLLSLPSTDRMAMLALGGGLPLSPVMGVAAANLELTPITSSSWDAFAVASELQRLIVEPPLEHLEVEHVQTLAACVNSQCASSTDSPLLTQQWTELFDSLRDYVFVALCDPDCVVHAVSLLEHFAFQSQLRDAVLREGQFLGILKLLHSEGVSDADCQVHVVSLLRNLHDRGHPYDATVVDVLDQFAKSNPSEFAGSPLSQLRSDL